MELIDCDDGLYESWLTHGVQLEVRSDPHSYAAIGPKRKTRRTVTIPNLMLHTLPLKLGLDCRPMKGNIKQGRG